MVVPPQEVRLTGFVLGVVFGVAAVVLPSLVILRRMPKNKEILRFGRVGKIDGIWQASDTRRKTPIDRTRPRIRRALVLDRRQRL